MALYAGGGGSNTTLREASTISSGCSLCPPLDSLPVRTSEPIQSASSLASFAIDCWMNCSCALRRPPLEEPASGVSGNERWMEGCRDGTADEGRDFSLRDLVTTVGRRGRTGLDKLVLGVSRVGG